MIPGIVAARRRSTAAAGVIDDYLTDIWGAYGLVKLVGTYPGACLRVRRSSDNTEQDIGFIAGGLDTSAMLSFVSGGDAFIVIWYDQSGGGHDLGQSTQASQPQIVDAGTYIGDAMFDGSNDSMATSANSGTPTGVTVHLAGHSRLGDSTMNRTLVAHSSFEWAMSRTTGDGDDYVTNLANGGTGLAGFVDASSVDATTYCATLDRTQTNPIDELKLYANGSAVTSFSSSGSGVSGGITAGTWKLGYNGSSQWARLAVSCLLIYEAVQSNATVSAIAPLIKPVARIDQLDDHITNLWGLYSLRRQRSAYSGPCIRVRRSSDNTEQDIGFSSGLLDTASLLAFVGAGSGFVTKFYDQSGSARDLSQGANGNQPRIVNFGAVDLGIVFDGSNDYIKTAANSSAVKTLTCYFRGFNSGTGERFAFCHNVLDTNGQTGLYHEGAADSLTILTQNGSGNNKFVGQTTNFIAEVVLAAWIDRAQSASGATATCKLYCGGALLAGTSLSNVGTVDANIAVAPWTLGSRDGASVLNGRVHTFVIYEAAHSATAIERVSRGLG